MSVTNRELLEAYARMASQAYDNELTAIDPVATTSFGIYIETDTNNGMLSSVDFENRQRKLKKADV